MAEMVDEIRALYECLKTYVDGMDEIALKSNLGHAIAAALQFLFINEVITPSELSLEIWQENHIYISAERIRQMGEENRMIFIYPPFTERKTI